LNAASGSLPSSGGPRSSWWSPGIRPSSGRWSCIGRSRAGRGRRRPGHPLPGRRRSRGRSRRCNETPPGWRRKSARSSRISPKRSRATTCAGPSATFRIAGHCTDPPEIGQGGTGPRPGAWIGTQGHGLLEDRGPVRGGAPRNVGGRDRIVRPGGWILECLPWSWRRSRTFGGPEASGVRRPRPIRVHPPRSRPLVSRQRRGARSGANDSRRNPVQKIRGWMYPTQPVDIHAGAPMCAVSVPPAAAERRTSQFTRREAADPAWHLLERTKGTQGTSRTAGTRKSVPGVPAVPRVPEVLSTRTSRCSRRAWSRPGPGSCRPSRR
jgi:hypothetical protein